MIGTEDLEKMTTLEITKKLVSLFEEYDSLRDDELNMLEDNPIRDMWDSETEDTYNTLVKDIVEKYDEIKSICDYVKGFNKRRMYMNNDNVKYPDYPDYNKYPQVVKDSIDFIKKNSYPSVRRTPFLIKDF